MLAIALVVALGQYPTHRLQRQPNLPRAAAASSSSYAFFELAPASGAGMTAACTCTSITGASGQAVTFTRASSAWCTKGDWDSNIANGDLVSCSTDQIRVMPGGDGTGVNGVLLEATSTNSLKQSETFDNATWTKSGTSGGSVPTVTANQAVAPDGTTTADRVQFSACVAVGSESVIGQDTSVASASGCAGSVYVKGVSGSGTIALCQYSNAANACSSCSFNSTTWTRCSHKPTNSVVGNWMIIGCENSTANYPNTPGNTGAADVYLWGGQHECSRQYVTSYIGPTTTAAITRAVDKAYVDLGVSGAVPTIGRWSAAVTTTRVSGATNMTAGSPMLIGAVSVSATDRSVANGWWMYSITNGSTIRVYENSTASGTSSTTAVTWTAADESRGWARSDSSDGGYSVTWSSASANSTPVVGSTPTRYFQLAGGITGTAADVSDVLIKKVCYSANSSECR